MVTKDIIDMEYYFLKTKARFEKLQTDGSFSKKFNFQLEEGKYSLEEQDIIVSINCINGSHTISVKLRVNDLNNKEISEYIGEINLEGNWNDQIMRGCHFY